MKEVLRWINSNRTKMILIGVAIILLPVIVVHILFKIPAPCIWVAAEWEAGDLLGYVGDILSFGGSLVLGIVAISQTEKANDMSLKLLELEKRRSKPCFDFINSQKYKIYFGNDIKRDLYKENDSIILNILYCSEPRSGVTVLVIS